MDEQVHANTSVGGEKAHNVCNARACIHTRADNDEHEHDIVMPVSAHDSSGAWRGGRGVCEEESLVGTHQSLANFVQSVSRRRALPASEGAHAENMLFLWPSNMILDVHHFGGSDVPIQSPRCQDK